MGIIDRIGSELPVIRWAESNRVNLGRLAIVIGVLLVGVISPRIAGNRFAVLLIVAPLGVAGVILLLRKPALTFPVLVAAGLAVPFKIGTGTQTSFNAAMLALGFFLGLWVLQILRNEDTAQKVPFRRLLPLVVFLCTCLISFLFGQVTWFYTQGAPLRAQIGAFALFILAVGAFFLVAHKATEQIALEWMTWALILLGSVYILGWYIPLVGSLAGHLFLNGSTGSQFWTWLVAMAFSQMVFNTQLKWQYRAGLGILLLAVFYISMVRELGWTSGWVPPLAAVGVIVWMGYKRLRPFILIAAAIGAVLLFPQIRGMLLAGDNEYSLVTRLAAWNILVKIIQVNPLFGVGFANYYWYTPMFHIMGYYVQFNSHNNYVDLIAQTGLIGLVCFLWYAVENWLLGERLRERVDHPFARAYVYGCLGGLAGTVLSGMLGDWILPFVYNLGYDAFRSGVLVWLFTGGLVALEQITRRKEALFVNGGAA